MLSATLRVRSNFAVHHLRAAALAARNSYNVEQANLTAEHGPWFDEMMLFVPVSVVMAGAALEASANELIQDKSRRGCAGRRTIGSWTDLSRPMALRMSSRHGC
jgi:hypothetical protein